MNVVQYTGPSRESIKLLTIYRLRIHLVLCMLLLQPQPKGYLQCCNDNNDSNYDNCKSNYNKRIQTISSKTACTVM